MVFSARPGSSRLPGLLPTFREYPGRDPRFPANFSTAFPELESANLEYLKQRAV